MSHAKSLPFSFCGIGSWGFLGRRWPAPSCGSRSCPRGCELASWEAPPAEDSLACRHSPADEAAGCQASLLKPFSASRADSVGRFSRNVLARWVSGVRTVILTSPPRSDKRTSTRCSPPVTWNFMSRNGVDFPASGFVSPCMTSCGRTGWDGVASVGSGGVSAGTCRFAAACGTILAVGIAAGVSPRSSGSAGSNGGAAGRRSRASGAGVLAGLSGGDGRIWLAADASGVRTSRSGAGLGSRRDAPTELVATGRSGCTASSRTAAALIRKANATSSRSAVVAASARTCVPGAGTRLSFWAAPFVVTSGWTLVRGGGSGVGSADIPRAGGAGCGTDCAGGIGSTVRGACPASANTCATELPDGLREGDAEACVAPVRRPAGSVRSVFASGCSTGAGAVVRKPTSFAGTAASGALNRIRGGGAGLPSGAGALTARAGSDSDRFSTFRVGRNGSIMAGSGLAGVAVPPGAGPKSGVAAFSSACTADAATRPLC